MSDREEFEKWAKYLFCGYSFNFRAGEYDDAEIDSAYMGWQAATTPMQVKLDEKDAEIARLKSVRLESVAYFDYDEEGGLFLKGRNDAIYHWNEYAEQGWKLKPLYTMKDE